MTDTDWAETADVSLRSLRMWARSKPLVIRELWEHGPADNASGQATGVLFGRMREHYPNSVYELGEPTALSMLIRDPVNSAAFHRVTRGKRTYHLELIAMPEIWYGKLMGDIKADMRTSTPMNGVKVLEPVEESPAIQLHDPQLAAFLENRETIDAFERGETIPTEPVEPSPAIEVEIASQVAMELLTRVVEIISAGSAAEANPELRRLRNELVHGQGLLAQRLEENDRLRKRVRETGDELAAVKMERDALRVRIRQTESNLTAALKGESALAVVTEVTKRVDRIMRETPKGKGE